MNGIETVREAIKLYQDAKLVLLTAFADTDAVIKAINEVRLNRYRLKPWAPGSATSIPCPAIFSKNRRQTIGRFSKDCACSAPAGLGRRTKSANSLRATRSRLSGPQRTHARNQKRHPYIAPN